MAISPDGAKLYALLEGAVAGDDPQDLRIYVFDVAKRAFADGFLKLRLEMPSQTGEPREPHGRLGRPRSTRTPSRRRPARSRSGS